MKIKHALTALLLALSGATAMANNDGTVVEVYNLTGVKVATYRAEVEGKMPVIKDLPTGYYILKMGQTVRKISIQ